MQGTQYSPSRIEALLGPFYKWYYICRYSFNQTNLRFMPFLLLNFGSVLDFAITIFLWTLIDSSPSRISYFFFGFMFQRLIWSQFMMNLGSDIVSGKISNRLLQPINTFNFWFFREIGASAVRNTISSVLILSFLPLYGKYLQLPNPVFLLILPILLFLAFFIDFCFSYIIASIAFWNEDFRPFGFIFSITVKILSGLAIPFTYFSTPISTLLLINPYSLVTYHPMQIYLGNYSSIQILNVITGGIVWCVSLYLFANWIFKKGLKKNESVGL